MSVDTSTSDPPFVFSPDRASTGDGGRYVDQTRREIASLVREVAAATGLENAFEFASVLVTRTAAAIGAQGVVLWRFPKPSSATLTRDCSQPPEATSAATDSAMIATGIDSVARCGNVTDQTLPAWATEAHRQLLLHVMGSGQPVVVPPSPDVPTTGSQDRDDAMRNPSDAPAALVPVPLPDAVDAGYLLEVFLPEGGGVTVQRGYLRFVSQMADLAGTFYTGECMRRLVRQRDWSAATAAILDATPPNLSGNSSREWWTDQIAETFSAIRVTWCKRQNSGDRFSVRAVSHCERIDASAAGVRALVEVAHKGLELADQPNDPSTQDFGPITLVRLRQDKLAEPPEQSPVTQVLVAKSSDDVLVIESNTWEPAASESAARAFQHAITIASAADRVDAMPLGRLLARKTSTRRPTRRLSVALGFIIVMAVAAGLPMPNNLLVPISIEPVTAQTVYCTRDAVVREIFVEHDQFVKANQPLLRLEDRDLVNEKLGWLGKRDVLMEQAISLDQQLLSPSLDGPTRQEVQRQRRLNEVELQSVQLRLDAIDRLENDLILRSAREGAVDAWDLHSRWIGKPARRGDRLLRVVASETDWIAKSPIEARDLDDVARAIKNGSLIASLRISGAEDVHETSKVHRLTPATSIPQSQGSSASTETFDGDLGQLELRFAHDQVPSSVFWRDGASGSALIRCGNETMVRWVWGDAIDWARDHSRLLIASWTDQDTE